MNERESQQREMEREQTREEGGKDRQLNPEHPEISGFVPYVNHSFYTRDSAAASVGA